MGFHCLQFHLGIRISSQPYQKQKEKLHIFVTVSSSSSGGLYIHRLFFSLKRTYSFLKVDQNKENIVFFLIVNPQETRYFGTNATSFYETGVHYVAQASLEVMITLC